MDGCGRYGSVRIPEPRSERNEILRRSARPPLPCIALFSHYFLTASCSTTKTLLNPRHNTTYALQPHTLPLLLPLFFIFPFFCSSLLALSDNRDTAYRRKAATTRCCTPSFSSLSLYPYTPYSISVTGTPEVAFTSTATDIPARARSASAMTALRSASELSSCGQR
jgi:hypothetical protein